MEIQGSHRGRLRGRMDSNSRGMSGRVRLADVVFKRGGLRTIINTAVHT